MTRALSLIPFGVVLFLMVLTGCGGTSLAPVSGKVLVKGKPAVGAQLMFFAEPADDLKSMPGNAVVRDDGTFTVGSGPNAGLTPGKYVVTVVWPDPAKKPTDLQRMAGANPNDAPDLLGGRYAKRETSKLRIEIKSGSNELQPFELD